jgi:hypothetical protein
LKKRIFFIFLALCFPNLLEAEWTQEIVEAATLEIQKTSPSWTIEETIAILKEYEGPEPSIQTIGRKEGKFNITLNGETILINGKDITGNLGSKITHGDNSPIFENVDNSQIAVGEKATASKETKKTSINLAFIFAISLSIPLSVSFVFNIILLKKLKKERKSRNN